MRLATLVLLTALASAGHAQQFYTTTFLNQDFHSREWKEIERFGKNETEIVAMGHERFVAWYCDPTRAGKQGRVQAEKVYGLAFHECNAPLLARLSRPEQVFMETAISALADAAKSSVVTAVHSFGDDKSWSLAFAESGRNVSETVHALLNPKAKLPDPGPVQLDTIYRQVEERIKTRNPAAPDGASRLKFVVGHIEKLFKTRSPREQSIARSFAHRMARLATRDPGNGDTSFNN